MHAILLYLKVGCYYIRIQELEEYFGDFIDCKNLGKNPSFLLTKGYGIGETMKNPMNLTLYKLSQIWGKKERKKENITV